MEKLHWSVKPARPIGMPFRLFKEGESFVDNGQRGFVFTYAKHQEPRFDKVMEISKERGEWAKIFGGRVFPIKMVPPYNKKEPVENTIRRGPYQDIVRKAAAGTLSTGHVVVEGMRNINKKYTF